MCGQFLPVSKWISIIERSIFIFSIDFVKFENETKQANQFGRILSLFTHIFFDLELNLRIQIHTFTQPAATSCTDNT